MKRACEGYCGGYANLRELHSVGEHGERFCRDCFIEQKRREYYE